MATPAVNIVIDKGTYFENTFYVNNSDSSAYSLVGYSAAAKIRKHPSSQTAYSFKTNIVASKGEITVSMAGTITSQLSEGRNYYDVIITDPYGDKIKVIEGNAIVNPSVSI